MPTFKSPISECILQVRNHGNPLRMFYMFFFLFPVGPTSLMTIYFHLEISYFMLKRRDYLVSFNYYFPIEFLLGQPTMVNICVPQIHGNSFLNLFIGHVSGWVFWTEVVGRVLLHLGADWKFHTLHDCQVRLQCNSVKDI